jgi:hypothetical protein
MRTRSIEFMPFLLSLFNLKEIGLVWLCLCWSYWRLHYGKCILMTTDHPYPNSFIPQALNFGSMIRKVVQIDYVHLNPNISSQFNYMENLGKLVQFELTSHFNKLSFCPIFRSQMDLEPCLAWHNFFCTLSTGMQLQLLPNS